MWKHYYLFPFQCPNVVVESYFERQKLAHELLWQLGQPVCVQLLTSTTVLEAAALKTSLPENVVFKTCVIQ